MLYVTTRSDKDAFTAQRVLNTGRGPDGGLYVPFRIPRFSEEEILALGGKSFNACLADTLNLLFNTRLTAYDIDFSVGRYAVRLQQLNQRLIMAESWHNTQWRFSRTVANLVSLIRTEQETGESTSDWAEVGVRIAVLFGIFGELIRCGLAGNGKYVDISLISGNFSGPMSTWYARYMGLPIGNIVCCCNENGKLWDLICHGQFRTDGVAVSTAVPEADVVIPEGLERLIYTYGGPDEVDRYLSVLRRGGMYYVEDAFLHRLRQGLYVTVSGERRILETIPSVYATHSYLLSPGSALAVSGLLDYRARTGETRHALVFTEKSPMCDLETVSQALGIQPEELKRHLDQNA